MDGAEVSLGEEEGVPTVRIEVRVLGLLLLLHPDEVVPCAHSPTEVDAGELLDLAGSDDGGDLRGVTDGPTHLQARGGCPPSPSAPLFLLHSPPLQVPHPLRLCRLLLLLSQQRSCLEDVVKTEQDRCVFDRTGKIYEMELLGSTKLRLGLVWAGVHDVFHVSMLRKYIPREGQVVQDIPSEIRPDVSYKEVPLRIVDVKLQQLHKKTIEYVKVQWSNHTEREATWELSSEMKEKYPYLFERPSEEQNLTREEVPREDDTSENRCTRRVEKTNLSDSRGSRTDRWSRLAKV